MNTIDELINCPKIITHAARKEDKLENRSYRNDYYVESIDRKYSFVMFTRKNEIFPENFTVGLKWVNNGYGKDIVLLRCNGPHGGTYNLDSCHFIPHIHKLTNENLERENFVEDDIIKTEEYSTLEEAVKYFCSICHISNPKEYFKYFSQTTLF